MKRVIAASIFFTAALAACNARQGPSLSETFSLMDQTYNPDPGGPSSGLGHGNQSYYLKPGTISHLDRNYLSHFFAHDDFTR